MIFTDNVIILLIITFFICYFSFSNARKSIIISFSLLLYATWYPPAILLLLFHAALGFYGGKKIAKFRNKSLLFIVIFLALLPLLFFKYFPKTHYEFILPLGLSFYTFSMISYYVDIYSKKIKAQQNFADLLLFISFWPHLAAGPILRAKNIFSSIYQEEKLTQTTLTLSILLLATGLFKKLLIADNIGAYVNSNISFGVESMSILEAWATILGFSAQIYADFSGYSDMAIGFALLMGFKLPANFNYPYRATTITEFWHRWHISLSTFFKDYLYVPLGGSKHSKHKTYLNIMIVFILSGVWHGVGIGFAIWGAIHGFILILEKLLGQTYLRVIYPLRWFITTILVITAWSFFRLDYSDAIVLIQKMFGFHSSLFIKNDSPYYVAVIFMILIYPIVEHMVRFYKVNSDGFLNLNNKKSSIVILSIFIFLAFTFSGSPLPFIYFKF